MEPSPSCSFEYCSEYDPSFGYSQYTLFLAVSVEKDHYASAHLQLGNQQHALTFITLSLLVILRPINIADYLPPAPF